MTSVSFFFVIVRRSVYILFTDASKLFVPSGSRGPVTRPFERMGVASPMPNSFPLSGHGTEKVGPKDAPGRSFKVVQELGYVLDAAC